MKRRFISLAVALVFALPALLEFVDHHHDDGETGTHEGCAACVWAVNAATDLPVTTAVPPVLPTPTEPVFIFSSTAESAIFIATTASRAPPETLA